MDRQIRNLARKIEVAVATPGRLIDLLERGELDLDEIGILIIDEADRMADMGFLPQVEWIMRKVPDNRQTLLFSATLDREVDVLVRRYMRDPVLHEVVTDTQTVDEMLHRFLKVHELDRIKVLAAISHGRVANVGVRAHEAWCRQAGLAAQARGRGRRRDSRRPAPVGA